MMTSAVTRIDTHMFGPWAIVTGASSGIGKEFARQLAAGGLHLVLVARRISTLEELGARLATEFGVQYRAVGVDLTEEHFLSKIDEATHDLDVGLVVSNAGTWLIGDFLTMDYEVLQRSLYLNVKAHVGVAHHFGQHLAQRRRGGLLLTASTAGLQGIPFNAEYAAAKAYVLTLGEGLHGELQKVGVHVTVLLPGATDTPMLAASGFDLPAIFRPMSTEQCVAEGLAALSANRATQIAGRMNRILAWLVPRSLATKMFGSMSAQVLAKRNESRAATNTIPTRTSEMRKPFHMTAGLRIVSTIITALLRMGLPVGPAVLLSVPGRKSGKIYTVPVEVVKTDGSRWLVAAFGDVSWVRNLRAAGQAQLTRRRRTESIGVVEAGAREAAPVLKQFLRESQGVSFIKTYFHVTPQSPLVDFELEALHHAVFRIVRTNGGER